MTQPRQMPFAHDDRVDDSLSFGQSCRLLVSLLLHVTVRRMALVRLLLRTVASRETKIVTKYLLRDSLSYLPFTLTLRDAVGDYAPPRVIFDTARRPVEDGNRAEDSVC
jgi:hypothetical protein